MKMKSSNVFTEILPFLLTLKFFGIFPLSFNADNGCDLRTKKSDKLMSVIAVILMALVSTTVILRAIDRMGRLNIVGLGWVIW